MIRSTPIARDRLRDVTSGDDRRGAAAPRRSGFTLLELLLVLAILVTLGGLVMYNFVNVQDDANVKNTEVQLKALSQQVQMYRIRLNALPKSLDELVNGPSDPKLKAKWTGSIIDAVPEDAWNNAINYKVTGNQFEIRSAGLDGQMNTDDDIVVTN